MTTEARKQLLIIACTCDRLEWASSALQRERRNQAAGSFLPLWMHSVLPFAMPFLPRWLRLGLMAARSVMR